MWRVMLPLVLVLLGPAVPERELLYVQGDWIWGIASGRLYEGAMPTRCSDGSVVYVREGDLWRDGVRIEATVGHNEAWPSCVEDILYAADGYVWRLHEGDRERLWRGDFPALSPDGRIAYRDWFQGVQAIYVWDDGNVVMTYPGRGGFPSWAPDGRLYLNGGTNIGYWDGTMHWLDILGTQPCWTDEGLYYTVETRPGQYSIYRDGESAVEDAWQPAW